jgi:UrcA family protein
MKPQLAALCLALAFGALAPAHADPTDKTAVAYADLDLARPADGSTLLARIRDAARTLCMQPGYTEEHTTAGCTRRVVAATVERLQLPMLTAALDNGRSRRTVLASR